MEQCEQCGNHYADCITVEYEGRRHIFDCFECAIFALAPACGHCGCRVIGHGTTGPNHEVYCCDHCLREHQLALGQPMPAKESGHSARAV